METAALRATIESAFPGLWGPTEAAISTVLAMVPQDVANCPTLILTGPASSSKTTVLEFLGEIPGVTYRSDKFTPRAFVSHVANVKREQLEQIDLLPRMKHRVLITPELAPTFRQRDDALRECIAILTAVLDGRGYTSDSGTQGRRGYTGDYLFGWLGATTPLPAVVWDVMAQLGSRLLFYAMPDVEVGADQLDQALIGTPYRDSVETCRLAVGKFILARLRALGGVRGISWDPTEDPEAVRRRIGLLARLLARLRSAVPRDEDGSATVALYDETYRPPDAEIPFRAQATLYNLARGRALLDNRTRLAPEDLPLVVNVVLSSMPDARAKVIRALIREGGALTTRRAAAALGQTLPTARRRMMEMAGLGVATLTGGDANGQTLTLRPEWRWCLDLRAWGMARAEGGESETDLRASGGESGGDVRGLAPALVGPDDPLVIDPWMD
jgi:hypothetical protein